MLQYQDMEAMLKLLVVVERGAKLVSNVVHARHWLPGDVWFIVFVTQI